MRLIYLSASWVCGICLGMWAGFHWGAVAAVAGAALLAFFLHRRRALLFVLCLTVLLLGILRYDSTVASIDSNDLRFYNDMGAMQVKGVVASDPEPANNRIAFRFDAREIQAGEEWREVSGTALVYAPRLIPADSLPAGVTREPPYYRYGDLLRIDGILQTPPEFEDFDWRDYLAHQGIHTLISSLGHIEILDTGQGSSLQSWIYGARDRLSRSLGDAIPEPQASLAQALLLGEKGTIPDDLKSSLSQAGTAHILAISGLHIFIVCGIVFSFAVNVFGRRHSVYLWLPLLATWGYALLSGMQVSTIRAAIMISLWLVAYSMGRPRSALPWLLLAAAVMIGINPSITGDVSFQLSFAAMAGLLLLTPHFQSRGRSILRVAEGRRPWLGFVIDSFAITLGAFLTIMPVIAYYFHHVSLVALPANFFALPVLPLAISTAATVAVVGLFTVPLAQVLGWVAWLFLGYMIEVSEFFAALPFASVELREVDDLFVWAYYALLGALLLVGTRRKDLGDAIRRLRVYIKSTSAAVGRVPAKYMVLPLLVAAALVWIAAASAPDNRLHVFFLDAGQGDAILIQKGHKQVLIDGGPDADRICLELGDKLPFWDRTIEVVVSTHHDADHLTGLVGVVGRYTVNGILSGGGECDSLICEEWRRLVEARDIDHTIAVAGQRIILAEDMVLDVLHPPKTLLTGTASDSDNNSVVLRLEYGDFSLLLTGDIYEEAERYLLDGRFDLRSVALKVPHHGSDTSSSPEFLTSVDPQAVVVSVGTDNDFGHPDPEVVERLTGLVGGDNLYLTSEHGTVEFITDGEKLWVKTEG
jgi:competence protein ComEC